MKLRDLDALRTFMLIYESRSLTKTSVRLNISKAATAKRLSQFEEELGHKLFRRSTRLITPTQEGEDLFKKAKSLLENVENFENSFNESSSMKGVIRITCANSMAQRFLADELVKFQIKHPEVAIDLVVTDSVLDLVEHNIDLAIRINPSKSSQLVGKKICDYRLRLIASPKYLKRSKPIKKLSDLKDHPAYFYLPHGEYAFSKSGAKIKEVLISRKFITNDSILLTRFIRQGSGIGVRASWDVRDDLKNKELVEIFPQDPLEKIGEVWLLSSTGRMQTHRVRELFSHLSSELKRYIE